MRRRLAQCGIAWSTSARNKKSKISAATDRSRIHELSAQVRPLPKQGVARYILTSAQNNTRVNKAVWTSLQTLARWYGAEILISRFGYSKAGFHLRGVKPGTGADEPSDKTIWYDPLLGTDLFVDQRTELAPTLVFCGEMNILPTASRPLSGFETYTGQASGIFPHAKISMQSIPRLKKDPAKFNYTTGTVTRRNYIQARAGQRAEFHHCYGGLLAEVLPDGRWFTRQLNCTENGDLQDLGVRVFRGKITEGNRVESITWGDIHVAQLDRRVADLGWDEGGILDSLRPRHQFLHDVLDFRARNHHDRGNPHTIFRRFTEGEDSVSNELRLTASFLASSVRDFCATYVVDSNHDGAMMKWLRESDYKSDPCNAILFLSAQLETFRAIERKDKRFHLVEHVLRESGCPVSVQFLREDESCVVAGVEHGIHGHLGPDGQRGSPQNLARMGRKANSGHTHSAQILDGMYVAGLTGALEQGYNRGPTSWSHSHVITYPTGKRTLITISGDKWRG